MLYEQHYIFESHNFNQHAAQGAEDRNRILACHELNNQDFVRQARIAFISELKNGPCDLRNALHRQGVTIPPEINPSALGSVTGALSRKRIIERTRDIAPAPQRQAHARSNPIWKLAEGASL